MGRSASTAWKSDAPATADEARNRLIDAAEVCFARYGVPKTTLEDIASTAGVSRATVYRYFDGGRDEIILGVLLREVHTFLDSLTRVVQRETDFSSAIVEGVIHTVSKVTQNTHLALLFAPEVAGETSAIAGASSALFDVTTDFLSPFFEAARANGQLRDGVRADTAAEFVLRIILSLLTVPGPASLDQARQREFVRTFCASAIVAS